MKLKIFQPVQPPIHERELFLGLKEFGKAIYVVLKNPDGSEMNNGYLVGFIVRDGKVILDKIGGVNGDLVQVDHNSRIKEVT